MKSLLVIAPAACTLALAAGCAHNHGNNYAYAPPYSPPVYPQPTGVTQPVSYAAPVVTAPALPPGTVVPGPATPCPQPCPDGTAAPTTVAVPGGGQTPPCPPGP